MNEPNFNLGHELGEIRGGINLLLERTADLPELRKTVDSHDRQLRFAKWVGATFVVQLLGLIGAWLKANLFSTK